MGKKLEEEQSSFHVTHAQAGGTMGWRAPECISHNYPSQKVTKSVDVFSSGCLMYYILTEGNHPYGDKLTRENNITKGIMKLDPLEKYDESVLSRDLIKRMIALNPLRRYTCSYPKMIRPDMKRALIHPYFWNAAKRLSFLQDVSDRLEGELKEASELLKSFEKRGSKVISGPDWMAKLDPGLLENLGKYRKYDGSSVQDLLRVLRNKRHHYSELPIQVQKTVGDLPDGYLNYFDSLFPNLLAHVYQWLSENPQVSSETVFSHYFE